MNLTRKEIIEDFEKYCEFIAPPVLKNRFLPHHRIIMRAINAAINGTGPRRIAFMMPPRHWKTLIGRDWFMSYMFGRFGNKIGVYATYNEDFANAAKDSVATILASEEYKWLFPNARTRNTAEDFEDFDKSVKKGKKDTAKKISNVNSDRGQMNFVGRGNALTGIGSHYSSLDDPYKDEEEGLSEKINATIWGWFSKVFLTREEPGNITLIFYTRWLGGDIIGRLEEEARQNQDPNYVPFIFFRFPAEKDEFEDPLYASYEDTREVGSPLDPERVTAYATAKKDPDKWMAMYQQTPLDVKGLLFDISLFGRYTQTMRWNTIVISVDTNSKKRSKTADTTGIEVWGKLMNKYWLIEIINRKMDYPELYATVAMLCEKYAGYWALVIEDASNGQALIPDMRSKGFKRIIACDPHGSSKRERANLILPLIQSGAVMIPSMDLCPNINEFLIEVSRFSGLKDAEKDDLVDAMVLALNYYEQFGYLEGTMLTSTVPNLSRMYYDNRSVSNGNNRCQNRVVEVRR